jgi:putative hydrolase of the HAD superfamily
VKRYRHLFFDLDHTLWDFRTNSRATLTELYHELDLPGHGVAAIEGFIEAYEEINAALWRGYSAGHVDKDVLRVLRFRTVLLQFGVKNDRLARSISEAYIERCPRKPGLMPGALELLGSLRPRFVLHIITNGFRETQHTKLQHSGLTGYFTTTVTSEQAGARKPDARIFSYALRHARAETGNSLMIGDDLTADIGGARNAGIDQVLFDPYDKHQGEEATHRVAHLSGLLSLLG